MPITIPDENQAPPLTPAVMSSQLLVSPRDIDVQRVKEMTA